jgi:glycine oxidase
VKKSDIDALVVGAGLGGALLRYRLHLAGLRVLWVDPDEANTATRASAGIMNPVTGRRFTLSWRFGEMLKESLALYGKLEHHAETPLLHKRSLLRTLFTERDQEQWMLRMGSPGYQELMRAPLSSVSFPFLRDAPTVGLIQPVWQVDLPAVVRAVSAFCGPWIKGKWLPERTLELADGNREDLPDAIPVFLCSGAASFPLLPLKPFKGEALIIRSHDLPADRIIHHKLKVVPLGKERYWVGSRDSWSWKDTGPENDTSQVICQTLDQWFDIRYQVEEVLAGIRPSSVRRRPFAGRLPGTSHTWVLNGLGTKGASLAPLVSADLVRQFLGEEEGDPELRWPWTSGSEAMEIPLPY